MKDDKLKAFKSIIKWGLAGLIAFYFFDAYGLIAIMILWILKG